MGPTLTRLMMVLSLIRWQPDYLIGLTLPKLSNPRFAERFGYENFVASAIRWNNVQGNLVRYEGLVWSKFSDLLALVREERADDLLSNPGKTGESMTVRKQ